MAHKPVQVRDHRRVKIDTSGPIREERPRLWTPSGRSPIAVDWVEITYDIPTAELGSVTAGGYLIEERDIRRRGQTRASGALVRRVPINWRTHQPQGDVPLWLAEKIETYRPVRPDSASAERVVASYVDTEHVPNWQGMVADLLALGRPR